MAKQSMKQQIYQSIANSQVQQVMAQKREQEIAQLQASFDAWNKQQDEIANLQAQYDSWLAEQPKPVQPTVTTQKIPSLSEHQKLVNKAVEERTRLAALDKKKAEEQKTKEENRAIVSGISQRLQDSIIPQKKEEPVERTPERTTKDSYARQQQEENMLASQSAKKKTSEILKDISVDNNRFNAGANISGKNSSNDYRKAILSGIDVNNQPEATANNEIEDLAEVFKDSMKDYAPKFTYRGKKWNNPYDSLSEEQKQAVKDYIIENQNRTDLSKEERETLNAFNKAYLNSNDPKDANYNSLSASLNSKGNFGRALQAGAAGFVDFNMPIAELAEKGLTKLPILNQANDEKKVEDLKQYIEDSKALNEKAADTGRSLGQIYDYAVTSPFVNGIGAAAGLSKAGTAVLNQLIQAGQDVGLDIYPEAQRMLREEGKINWGELAARFAGDVGQNIFMESVPYLGAANYDSLVKTVGNNADIFKNIDATGALKNVPDYIRSATDALEGTDKIPFVKSVSNNADSIVKNATEQAEEAAQNIENLAKQIPDLPEEVSKAAAREAFEKAPRHYVGKATTIIGDYDGPVPEKVSKNTSIVPIEDKYFDEAITNIGDAKQNVTDKLSEKTILGKLYKTLFGKNNQKYQTVNGLLFDGDPYTVTVNKNVVGKIMSDGNVTPEKLAVLQDIEKVIKDADYVGTAPKFDYKGNGKKSDVIRYDYFETPVTIKGNEYLVSFDVEVLPAQNKYRTHRVINELNLTPATGEVVKATAPEVQASSINSGNLPGANKGALGLSSDLNVTDGIENVNKQSVKNTGEVNKVMAEDAGLGKVPEPESDTLTFDYEKPVGDTPSEPLTIGEEILTPDNYKERGTSKHIRGDGKMKMEDVADEVAADFQNDPDMYKVLRNADTKAKAEKIFNESPDPEADFRSMLAKKDPASLPLGQALAKQYSAEGKYDIAAQLYRDMGEALTEAGQFSQAAIINMIKDDPMTALRYAQKEIDQLNAAGLKRYGKKWKDFSLLDDEAKMFNDIAPGDTEAIKNAYDKIGVRLGQEYPTTLLDKVIELRRAAMLFNPRTISRNFLANPPTMGMRWWADRHEALGQQIAHLINPEVEITQSIYGSGPKGRKIAKEVYKSDRLKSLIENMTSRADIPELKNAVMRNKQTFKGAFLSNWVDKLTGGGIEKLNEKMGYKGTKSLVQSFINGSYEALNVTDNPAVRENFVERLGSYIAAKKIKNAADIPDDAILMAWEESMKATYKDNSQIAKGIKAAKNAIKETGDGVIPGLGSVISQSAIPFVTAPGNIGQRMIDYSLVGLGKGIHKIIKGASTNDIKLLQKGIEEAAKGLSGTELVILGMKLRESGILTGTYSENKKQKAFQKQDGFREFALHLGDGYHSIGWMQPFAEPVMAGALIQDAIEKSDELDSELLNYLGYEGTNVGKAIGIGKESGKAAVNSWFNETPLQNLAEMLGGSGYGKTDIAGNIWENGVADFAGAMVPSAVAATAKVVDTTQRNTYDPSNGVSTFVNTQMAKLPFLSEKLPAKYDVWGEEMKHGSNRATAAFSKYLYPGDYAETKNDPVNKEINRLFDATQENAVFPPTADYSVGDRKLNNREVSTFQEDMGKRNHKLVEAFINSEMYQSLEGKDNERAEVLKNLYGTSKVITQRDKFDKPVPDNSQYKKAIEAYDAAGGGEEGIKAIVDVYTGKKLAADAGLKSNSNAAKSIQADIDNGNVDLAKEKSEGITKLSDYGLNKPGPEATYTKAKTEYPDMSVEEFVETYNTIDKDHNQGLKKNEEVIPYMNSQGFDYDEGMKFWNAYANSSWNLPKLEDGKWK